MKELFYLFHGVILGGIDYFYNLLDTFPELFFIIADINVLFCFFGYYYLPEITETTGRKE